MATLAPILTPHTLPPHGQPWPRVDPQAAGFDPEALAAAITFAETNESPWRRDLRAQLEAGNFEPPPDNEIIGPVAPRGAPNGLLLRHGKLVATWGDTRQVDMTFSVAKSYLSLLAGLAVADGLIPDLDQPIAATVHDGGFDSPHNRQITWRQMLQLTSEWEGALFGKSEQIDRNRSLASEDTGRPTGKKGQARPLQTPGTFWEYNDVRVNRLSLALLRRFARPLPDLFAERIMQPLGASADWRWEGYRTSYVDIAGRQIQSVSGGGHWGGGVFIHAEDQARIGQLMLNRGAWATTTILPESWIAASVAPCALNPRYGLFWWLNSNATYQPAAPRDSVFAIGAGGNVTWIDPTNGLVAVLRLDRQHQARRLDRPDPGRPHQSLTCSSANVSARSAIPRHPAPLRPLIAAAADANRAAPNTSRPSASASANAPWNTSPHPVVSRTPTAGAPTRCSAPAIRHKLPAAPSVTPTALARGATTSPNASAGSATPVSADSPWREKIGTAAAAASAARSARSPPSPSNTPAPRARPATPPPPPETGDPPTPHPPQSAAPAAGARAHTVPRSTTAQRSPAGSTITHALGVRAPATTSSPARSTPNPPISSRRNRPAASSPTAPQNTACPPNAAIATAAVPAIPPPVSRYELAVYFPSPPGRLSTS